MVLWEITLATAYFLGLKRTYRLALRIQRRLIGPNHPKIRQFAHRRIRTVFDVALKVHYKVQERDIEVGRNLGNWILRWLDRMKPSAQIRAPSPEPPSAGSGSTMNMTKQVTNSSQLKTPANNKTLENPESGRRLFTLYRNAWSRPLAGISMIQVPKPLGNMTQYRHMSANVPGSFRPSNYTKSGFNGVFRKDIMEWMRRN